MSPAAASAAVRAATVASPIPSAAAGSSATPGPADATSRKVAQQERVQFQWSTGRPGDEPSRAAAGRG